MFRNAQDEIELLVDRLAEAEVRSDPKGIKMAILIFLGPKSPIYHVHAMIFPKEDDGHFATFMGGFYFSSSWNLTYSQCYNEPKIITDKTPDAKALPFAAGETGKLPNRKGKVFALVDDGLQKQCQNCLQPIQ